MVRKVTFTLDDQTIRRLEQSAERLGKPKSQIIREAVADFHDRTGRLSEAEKQRMLRVIRERVSTIRRRPAREIDSEIADLRASRRSGGRGGSRSSR